MHICPKILDFCGDNGSRMTSTKRQICILNDCVLCDRFRSECLRSMQPSELNIETIIRLFEEMYWFFHRIVSLTLRNLSLTRRKAETKTHTDLTSQQCPCSARGQIENCRSEKSKVHHHKFFNGSLALAISASAEICGTVAAPAVVLTPRIHTGHAPMHAHWNVTIATGRHGTQINWNRSDGRLSRPSGRRCWGRRCRRHHTIRNEWSWWPRCGHGRRHRRRRRNGHRRRICRGVRWRRCRVHGSRYNDVGGSRWSDAVGYRKKTRGLRFCWG